MCRYGVPYTLIADNDKQFDNHIFKGFCMDLRIELRFCSPAHPQANGQVEAANKTIKRLLKIKLGKKKRAWVDELPLYSRPIGPLTRLPQENPPLHWHSNMSLFFQLELGWAHTA